MKRALNFRKDAAVSEMAIVDTFTKLIFGEEKNYSNREVLIIQAFRAVDTNVALDNHRDMGEYLRALGVREMIQLVSRVQEQLSGGAHILVSEAGQEVLNRRVH